MTISELAPTGVPAGFDVQNTTFSHDVLGRYICNTWEEVDAAQRSGAYPFDVVVIGAGMFGGYMADKLYRRGAPLALRVLVLDAGAYLLPSHVQNLPQRLGGKIGGADALRTRDNGTQNVVWGMPWISNTGFPGLAYCLGGRSLFWGGWSPRLTDSDLTSWPDEVRIFLQSADGYAATEIETGVVPSTDYIVETDLYKALLKGFQTARATVPSITEVAEAPLAVQGSSPASGVFPFDKFSSAPFFIDAVRDDVATNLANGDVSRRLFFVPRAQVHRLNKSGESVTSIEFSVAGQRRVLSLAPQCVVVIANGTVECSRLALDSLGVGSTQFGSPRAGNLMAHLRSNITVRVKRAVLGLVNPPKELETVALIVRGAALNRRFHIQVTAAAIAGSNPEANMWSMVPDTDLLATLVSQQDPQWVTLTLRCIGEMEDSRRLPPDPGMSWIDLSGETDGWLTRRAFVNLVATQNDRQLWATMDAAAFDLAAALAQLPTNIQYWNQQTNSWVSTRPAPDASGRGFWQDGLGTTHHEAGTLFMGQPGSSVTNTTGRFHNVANAYVAGPAVFPTLGSANPSLTALSLARRTADAIVAGASPARQPEFDALSLDPRDWRMVRLPSTPDVNVKHYGKVLETAGGYGLYWYLKEQFADFVLRVEWRVARRDDNSGIYIRIPDPSVANPLQAADSQGHEIQIDERGYDSRTNTEGHPMKLTGAIYDLQAPVTSASRPIGQWNLFVIEADGPSIRVTVNGVVATTYNSPRQRKGFVALQAHHGGSRVQFRNLQVRRLK
jgi:choline dehydrogenase-like flavoprotein